MDSTKFLVELDDIKTYLGFTDDDTDRDNELGLFINLVSTLAETYTDRKFIAEEITEYLNGSHRNVLMLSYYPIIDTEETIDIRIDDSREFGEDTKLESGEIHIHRDTGVVYYLEGIWGTAPASVKAVYEAGWETVPYDIQLSVMEAVSYFWKRKNEKNWGISSITKGETSLTKFQTALPETVTEIWDLYRKRR